MSDSKDYFDRMAAEWDHNPMRLERATVTANKVRQLNLPNRRHLIDYGCGTGLTGLQLTDYFDQVHLVDASSEMLNVAQAKIDYDGIKNASVHQVEDIAALPIKASTIIMLMVLHHIHETENFFRKAYEKLEVGGALVVADLCKEDGSFHKDVADFDGHNGFDLPTLSAVARGAGFEVRQCEPYYEVWKNNFAGQNVAYPLFMLVAQKMA